MDLENEPQGEPVDPSVSFETPETQSKTGSPDRNGQGSSIPHAIGSGEPPRTYGRALTPEQRDWLRGCAIDDRLMQGITRMETVADLPPEFAGWRSAVPGLCFTWTSPSGVITRQLRPDKPTIGKDGRERKYLFPKDSGSPIGIVHGFDQHLRNPRIPVLIIEGTKQLLATASNISEDNPIAVPIGIAGCYGWKSGGKPSQDLDELALEDRDVIVAFDADVASNYRVHAAAKELEAHLTDACLTKSVRFIQVVGNEKDGLDDWFASVKQDNRSKSLAKLIGAAGPLPKPPRKPPKNGSGFFGIDGNFLPDTCWEYLKQEHRLALADDNTIAVYSGGVYLAGQSLRFQSEVIDLLGDFFKPEHLNTVHLVGLTELKVSGQTIPMKQSRLWINFKNGLLDPVTGLLHPHTPEYRSLIQWPYDWDPAAACPHFDRWLEEQLPGQGPALLEYCSQMLDQTVHPGYMVFLWGPSRSGKSTLIRILQALVGAALASSVSLHSLSARGTGEGRFAPSGLFAKVLNTFADLSSDDLGCLSVFKCLTGGDPIAAEYKGKDAFSFTNMAMLVFSANSIPAVSEASQAYFARSAPFNFNRTFLGKEDQGIEDRMMTELPGIMRRLTQALMDRKRRGRPLDCAAAAMEQFRRGSDKVALFLAENTRPGDRSRRCIGRAALYQSFVEWSREEQGNKHGRVLGKHKFNDRVKNTEAETFTPAGDVLRWNLLPVDPETAEMASKTAEETAEEGSPSEAEGDRGSQGADLGSFESENYRGGTPDGDSNLQDRSAVSAVLPHSSLPVNESEKTPWSKEWGKTAETAEPSLSSQEEDRWRDLARATQINNPTWSAKQVALTVRPNFRTVTEEQLSAFLEGEEERANAAWPEDQMRRRRIVEAGGTVVANGHRNSADAILIRWASKNGRLVGIGRGTPWGNPFVISKDGDRDAVCDSFAAYFDRQTNLHDRVVGLKGRVLSCWCYPARCHGDYLVRRTEEV